MAKMTGTVFTTDPDGAEVRLLLGEDAPSWYKGPAVEGRSSDDGPRSVDELSKDELRKLIEENELVAPPKNASKDEHVAVLLAADITTV